MFLPRFREILKQEIRKAEKDSIAGILYNEQELGLEDLVSELTGLIFAGFETTANTSAAALGLYLHEDDACREELLVIFLCCCVEMTLFKTYTNEELPNDPTDWTLFDVKNNKVADKVLRETLRLHPPAASHPVTAVRDVKVGKYTFEKGTHILCNYYAMFRVCCFFFFLFFFIFINSLTSSKRIAYLVKMLILSTSNDGITLIKDAKKGASACLRSTHHF